MNKLEPRLTTLQAAAVLKTVSSFLGYLNRLLEGLEKAGFRGTDTWYLVQKVHADVYHLRVFLHYESCKHGVAMPPKDE